ncbi:SusC/RagA family TonB-linked outer membrane protein [Flavobacterium saccharophilum]|uniref:TonB-linked outer membrane protein, SusC/RagA family n=1 Tax=Flavobacterium saccharophilum TaxID=29534 RepID=A0A1M7JM07_9FLAO|nr:TonB-dependent receptor [Flavobacterium saccharophilum]SHM53537.1 TonB-linked outer membrane protein, SusC/RagA family [Flavobacterium saccharophilum]
MKKDYLFWKETFPVMFILFFLCSLGVSAQSKLTGKVIDETGLPVPGATIKVEGSPINTATDLDGSYNIDAKENQTLIVSFIGYKTIKKIVGPSKELNITIQPDTQLLNEVVVVGYGTQKKIEVTGAVSTIKSDVIDKSPVADVGAALQGQVAGVNVQAASGRPGEASNIQIRGVGSLSGSTEPLYVVDGIPYQSNPNISPDQIESLDILKDGAAASVYGTRASNGVILITTKRGKRGKISIDFNTYAGIQNITSGTPLMNTQQQLFADYTARAMLSSNLPTYFIRTPDLLNYDSDYVGDVQNNNALIRNYGLGISGGAENLSLNFNTNYYDQDGILINSGFSRLSNRLNAQFTKGKFKAFASLGINREKTTQEPWALYEYAIQQKPWQVPLSGVKQEGSNVSYPVDNEILFGFLQKELQNVDERKVNSNNISLNLEYEIFKGLKYKVNLGTNSYDYKRTFFRPQVLVYNLTGEFSATASREEALLNEDYISSQRNTIENIVDYKRSFGNHNLNATLVSSFEEFNSKQIGVGVIGLLSNETPVLGAGKSATKNTSYDYNNTLSGLMGRIQYNYANRYLISASIRKDGSSNFGPDNRYGYFPGVSAGWNISEENFFKNSSIKNVVDNWKFRASYAQLGNQSIPPYTYSGQIESGANYLFGSAENLASGAIQRRYANPDVKWETSISSNIGMDVAMFKNKLSFTLDLYKNDKNDMLLPQQTPASSGTYVPSAVDIYSPIIVNAGNMTNKGIEVSLNYKNKLSNSLTYSISGNFSKNVNEITNLDGIERGYGNGRPTNSLGNTVEYTTFFAVGHEAGAFFLLQNAGVIKSQDVLDEYKKIQPSAKLGDIRYIDQDGDGVINDNDRVYAGSGQADFNAGLNLDLAYKGFDFSVQTYFSYGAKIYNGSRYFAYAVGRHIDEYSMWSPENPTSDIPSFRESATHSNVRASSDFFLEDGTYFRIRNLTFGYSLPESLMQKNGIGQIRLYLTGMNPFTFTKYTGYDPEVGGNGISTRGVDSGNYPVSRRFVLGLQVKF